MLSMFADVSAYGANEFNLTGELGLGGRAVGDLGKHFAWMFGGRVAFSTAGNPTSSRSYVGGDFHAAIALLYKQQTQRSLFLLGPSWARVHYTTGGVPEDSENHPFFEIRNLAVQERDWVRPVYYNGLYMFASYRMFGRTQYEFEVNLLVPSKMAAPINSWQPESLMHFARVKAIVQHDRLGIKIDAQFANLPDSPYANYKRIRLDQTTGRFEAAYTLRQKQQRSGSSLKLLVGVKRAWHPFNFPTLLAASGRSGVFTTPYIGFNISLNGIAF